SAATVLAAPPSWQADREQAVRQHAAGNYREAEKLFRTALIQLKAAAPADPHVPLLLSDLGAECHLLGKYTEAEQHYVDALAIWQNVPAPPVDAIARVHANLATTYRTVGRFEEAEAAYRKALQSLDGDSRYTAQFAFT